MQRFFLVCLPLLPSVVAAQDPRRDLAVVSSAITERYRAALEAGAGGNLRRAHDELLAVLKVETHTSAKLRLRLIDDAAARRTSDVAITLLFRAALHASVGKNREALLDIDSALAASPRYDEAYRLRGRTLVDLNDLSGALEAYDRALALNATNVMSFLNRGTLYLRQDRPALALADFHRAISLDPTNAESFVNRGLAFSAANQIQKGVADFDRAIALDSGLGPAYNNKALVLEQLGDEAAAAKAYQALIERSRPEYSGLIAYARERTAALAKKRPNEEL